MKTIPTMLVILPLIAPAPVLLADKLWVTCGTTDDLSARIDPRPFVVPAGKRADAIVDVAIDGRNNTCFAWFRGSPRQVSGGSSVDLGKYRKPYTSYFPANYDSGDVVGIAINDSAGAGGGFSGEDETTFIFFRNGKYTAGTTDNLNRKLYRYFPAALQDYDDIVAMAMDGVFSRRGPTGESQAELVVYTWYKNGTVSAGFMPSQIARLSGEVARLDSWKIYNYKLPKNWKSGMEILGIGIDGENNHVYTWYLERD